MIQESGLSNLSMAKTMVWSDFEFNESRCVFLRVEQGLVVMYIGDEQGTLKLQSIMYFIRPPVYEVRPHLYEVRSMLCYIIKLQSIRVEPFTVHPPPPNSPSSRRAPSMAVIGRFLSRFCRVLFNQPMGFENL